MGAVLITLGEVLAALFMLKLAVEQGEFLTGWVFEHMWHSIEVATNGRIKAGSGKKAIAKVTSKVKGWIADAILTLADPFIEIARSFMSQDEDVPTEPDPEQSHSAPVAPEPEPVAAAPDPVAAKPSEEAYRAAIARFGVTLACPVATLRRTWTKLQRSGDLAAVNADWAVICAFRDIRED